MTFCLKPLPALMHPWWPVDAVYTQTAHTKDPIESTLSPTGGQNKKLHPIPCRLLKRSFGLYHNNVVIQC